LFDNVDHKALFALETGLDSSVVCTEPHLGMPGDFPYDGFIRYRGVWAGGSGVMKEFDVVWVKKAVDIYAEIRGRIFTEAHDLIRWARTSWEGDIGLGKFGIIEPQMLEVWREAREQSARASDSFLAG
jgi:hypothetical protein